MTTEEFQNKFGIIGKSKAIKDLVDIIMQVSDSDISVLIQGESGTGKEVIARAIHNSSRRSNHKIVNVNCGAIPEGLLESELFGHKKGSFTGASDDRKGYFEIADKGTLFLDEIAEMPLTTQVRLLRVLETKEFMPIGSETVTKVDVRIIAASHKDLQKEVDTKKFRHDLFFRLKAVTLNIPPLRERREDIIPLIDFFMEDISKRNKIDLHIISPRAIDILHDYSWPGNIRELKNALETAIALSKENILQPEIFIPLLNLSPMFEETRNLPIHLKKSSEELDREMIYRALIEIKKDIMALKDLATAQVSSYQTGTGAYDPQEVVPLAVVEKNVINNALQYTRGNKRKAALLLKISERTFYRKLKEYNIEF